MPLAVRLLIALGLLSLLATALVGFSARDASRTELQRGFAARMEAATTGARDELVGEAESLAELVGPLCGRAPYVDDAVEVLGGNGGDPDRAANTSAGTEVAMRVLEQRRVLRLDQLVLALADGRVMAPRNVAYERDAMETVLDQPPGRARLVRLGGAPLLEAHCVRSTGERTLGLVGIREVEPILLRVGAAYGVTLTLAAADDAMEEDGVILRRRLRVSEIDGLEVTAAISRQPLVDAQAQIDRTIFFTGAIALLLAIALAVFVARSLSRPIVELARQTRRVVRGEPEAVHTRGGRELQQLARSFNRTIDELTVMRKRLARTERIAARREVARQVAHEIKNPLAPIQAAVETLRRLRERGSPAFDEYFDEATTIVLSEVHRIKTIVTEFTKFERLPPPSFARVDLAEIAGKVVRLHDASATGGARVRLQCKARPPLILADHDQLVQVLTNLVQNGIDAASSASDEPRVDMTLGADAERDVVRVTVLDNGPGVEPDVAARIFEPYVTTKAEGTGLGLAIAQRIAFEHGGEITCGEAPGGGARFELTLPVEGPPLLERPPEAG